MAVVMYRCENWTVKKAEHQRIDVRLWCLEKTLDSPLDSKEIKQQGQLILKDINPGYSLEGLMLKLKFHSSSNGKS